MTSEFPRVFTGRAKSHRGPALRVTRSFQEKKNSKITNKDLVLYQHSYANFVKDPKMPETCLSPAFLQVVAVGRSPWVGDGQGWKSTEG